VLAVFGEVFDAFDGLEAEAANDGKGCVAQCGERLWRVTGVGTRLILPPGNIAHVVQTVLDTPMLARQVQQTCGVGLVGAQAGDGIDRLVGCLAANDALAGQAAHLGEAAPGRRQVCGDAGGDLQAAGLDPAMAFLDCLGLCQVRRR